MTAYTGTHPEPPADLAGRKPLLYELKPGLKLFRMYHSNSHPMYFGRTADNRFDYPGRSFGVLYLGMDEYCSFIETFGQTTGIRSISTMQIEARRLAELEVVRPLKLIDLCSSGGLARIGADAGLLSGSHEVSQRWSAALRSHPIKPDGILYPARHDPARRACAIFDCPASVFRMSGRGSLLDSRNIQVLQSILNTYDFGLTP
jgi:hypothetical protein